MRKLFFAICLILCSLSLGSNTVGIGIANAQSNVISGIVVEGNQRIEARTIQSYLLLSAGDSFDPERLDLSLKTLFATGLFADVSFDRRGSDLIVRVAENPIINRVIFEGNSALDDDKFREEIKAAPRGIFTAARVQADVQKMLELYRRAGRFSANIEPQYKSLDQNRVDLIFQIVEGPVTGIRAINFIGNEEFSDRRLKSEIVTKESRFWRFFSSNDNYDPGRLEYDRELLRQFYQNKGFYDFRVISAVADLTPDQRAFYVTFTIDEGVKYNFGEIKVEVALEKLDQNLLEAVVPFREGQLYRGQKIESAIDSLTYAAGIAGYAFVDIRPRFEENPEERTVDVTFAIDEGPRVYIERIDIVGNTRTLDRVIRRELRISEGDAFNRVLQDRSQNRVRALGFFKSVQITESPGTEPDRSIVEVEVENQPTGELSFAAGFSSVDSFLLDFSVAERNLGGRGQTAVARVQASKRQKFLDIRFTEPRWFDRNLSAGFDIFGTETDYLEYSSFKSTSVGGSIRVSFPVTDYSNLGLRYRLSWDELDVIDRLLRMYEDPVGSNRYRLADQALDYDPINRTWRDGWVAKDQCDPDYTSRSTLCRNERSESTSIIGYSYSLDRRNDPIRPTGGYDFSINQDVAGLGGDVKYIRTEFIVSSYRAVRRNMRTNYRFSAGFIESLASGEKTIRINNRFFRGGNSFRGFDIAGLGPREVLEIYDAEGENVVEVRRLNALGGKYYYHGLAELTLPSLLPPEYGINSSLFLSAGSVAGLDDADYDPPLEVGTNPKTIRLTKKEDALRASTGLSIFWNSPFGPIRFDFSYILNSEPYDRTETFRFNTSTRF